MSEAEQATETGVMAIEAQAAAWLRRRHFWNWSESDQAQLDAWLVESTTHEVAFVRLEAAWSRTERLAALRLHETEPKAEAPQRNLRPAMRTVAALAIVGVLGAAVAFFAAGPRGTSYATAVGGHRTIALTDGSMVELNTDTVLRVAADRRLAWLDKGEAYFKIRHDAATPFVLMVGEHRVTDLGTEFLVRNDAQHFEVALVEGRARLESTSDGEPARAVLLTPGDVAVSTAHAMSVRKKPPEDFATELGWRRGVLVFDHTSLADAAAEFNRYNRVKLIVADAGAARRTIMGTFRANNIEDFTGLARDVLGLHVEKRPGEIVISR